MVYLLILPPTYCNGLTRCRAPLKLQFNMVIMRWLPYRQLLSISNIFEKQCRNRYEVRVVCSPYHIFIACHVCRPKLPAIWEGQARLQRQLRLSSLHVCAAARPSMKPEQKATLIGQARPC